MVVTAGTMGVTVGQLFMRCCADFNHVDIERQTFARQRMVAADERVFIFDLVNDEGDFVALQGRMFGAEAEAWDNVRANIGWKNFERNLQI